MTPEEQYPSTSDCPDVDTDDNVLATILNGRARVAAGHSITLYADDENEDVLRVCAIGGFMLAAGVDQDEVVALHGDWTEAQALLETALTQEAKEALRLLNEVALEEHPEASSDKWSGPLEWVNQDWNPPGFETEASRYPLGTFGSPSPKYEAAVQAEVLRLYDLAAERRRRCPA